MELSGSGAEYASRRPRVCLNNFEGNPGAIPFILYSLTRSTDAPALRCQPRMPLFGYSTSMHFSLKTLATQAVRDLLEAMTELASTWVGLSCLVSPKSCVLLPIRMILDWKLAVSSAGSTRPIRRRFDPNGDWSPVGFDPSNPRVFFRAPSEARSTVLRLTPVAWRTIATDWQRRTRPAKPVRLYEPRQHDLPPE